MIRGVVCAKVKMVRSCWKYFLNKKHKDVLYCFNSCNFGVNREGILPLGNNRNHIKIESELM